MLLVYLILFVLVYVMKLDESMVLLFLFETIQCTTCFSLLRIFQRISSDMSNAMLAIHIVRSVNSKLNSLQSFKENHELIIPMFIKNNHSKESIDLFH